MEFNREESIEAVVYVQIVLFIFVYTHSVIKRIQQSRLSQKVKFI